MTIVARVLLVDDDAVLVDMVTRYLERDGYAVDWLGDGNCVAQVVADHRPDLVILDLLLPGRHGRDACRDVRQISNVPILMLTALGDEPDRIAGLEVGADDYLAKPFSLRELVLRVRAILRRAQPPEHGEHGGWLLHDGDLVVDTRSCDVHVDGQLVRLTSREQSLLLFLLRHPHEVFSREQLLEQVWGWAHGDSAIVTVQVRRLREKIETNPSEPQRILTVWGAGYRYQSAHS
jgi:DNA-binding response OmpR family regulator